MTDHPWGCTCDECMNDDILEKDRVTFVLTQAEHFTAVAVGVVGFVILVVMLASFGFPHLAGAICAGALAAITVFAW